MLTTVDVVYKLSLQEINGCRYTGKRCSGQRGLAPDTLATNILPSGVIPSLCLGSHSRLGQSETITA